jgi:hypothetical protein
MQPVLPTTSFRTIVRTKEFAMLIILAIAAVWGGIAGGRAALRSLRSLPRRNEDMVFY